MSHRVGTRKSQGVGHHILAQTEPETPRLLPALPVLAGLAALLLFLAGTAAALEVDTVIYRRTRSSAGRDSLLFCWRKSPGRAGLPGDAFVVWASEDPGRWPHLVVAGDGAGAVPPRAGDSCCGSVCSGSRATSRSERLASLNVSPVTGLSYDVSVEAMSAS
ncbi:MAG TPA: hypothetical protein ENK19_00550 [Acidobacteria bacterium]|nr:hypothetical protein [Acidobacteriota bacterium]